MSNKEIVQVSPDVSTAKPGILIYTDLLLNFSSFNATWKNKPECIKISVSHIVWKGFLVPVRRPRQKYVLFERRKAGSLFLLIYWLSLTWLKILKAELHVAQNGC